MDCCLIGELQRKFPQRGVRGEAKADVFEKLERSSMRRSSVRLVVFFVMLDRRMEWR